MADVKKTAEEKIQYDPQYILQVKDLKKYFPIKGGMLNKTVGYVKAVDGVTFNLKRGTTMGLVGESGCGKTTTGRTILRLSGEKTGGQVLFNGQEVYDLNAKEMRDMRTKMQIIFQDPFSSLQPRMPVGEIIGEAVREHGLVPKEEFDDYIDKVMDDCGLQSFHKDRYPHEFSGGQRQRICIARALALKPEFIVCDEPVSALDVSIQAQIINLLKELQEQYKFTYLFISHDLSVVEHISDTVGVMYLGNLVEYGATEDIFKNPLHPYTKALFSAIPVPDPTAKMNRIVLEGSIPSPANPPAGCKFHTRFGDIPVMTLRAVGCGMGHKDFPRANCLRAMLGDTAADIGDVYELACNLDDMTGEDIAFAMERLLEAGALDVYTVPIGMKKSRPGVMLCVLCREEQREEMARLLLRHTTTLGVRESRHRRYTLSRAEETVDTPWGPVARKLSQGWGVRRQKPEYEDLARIAREQDLPLDQVRQQIR